MASILRHLMPSPGPTAASGRDSVISLKDSVVLRQVNCCHWNSKTSKECANLIRRRESGALQLNSLFARVAVSGGTRQQRSSPVCMVLPTGNLDSKTAEYPWEARAVKSFSMAELEARKLKYPSTGTESLLLGILTEGTSEAAKFLRSNGVTIFAVRDEIIKLLGKADMYFFSPEHPPITSSAQRALDWAIDPKNRPEEAVGKELSTTMLVLAIWAEKGSAGQQILENLGFNEDKLAELSAIMKKPARTRGIYQG